MGIKCENRKQRRPVGKGSPPVDQQFPKGHKGGPGRPKGNIITSIRAIVEEGKNDALKIATKLIAMSKKGDTRAVMIVLDRLYGKVPQPLTGGDGGPIKMIVVSEPDKL